MRKNKCNAALLLPFTFLSSCTSMKEIDYSAYYPDGSSAMKGDIIYCWKDKDSWLTTPLVVLCGRYREPWEVKKKQDSVAIPLKKMREILRMYPLSDRYNWMGVTLVTYPPIEEQLNYNSGFFESHLDTVNWLCGELGMGWEYDADGVRVVVPVMPN